MILVVKFYQKFFLLNFLIVEFVNEKRYELKNKIMLYFIYVCYKLYVMYQVIFYLYFVYG